jgi:hypothetical protein
MASRSKKSSSRVTNKSPARRSFLTTGLVASLSALAVAPRAGAAEQRPEWSRLRRVVTGIGADGRGAVLYDGEPTNVLVMNGTRITRLWEEPEIPVTATFAGDRGASAGNAYREGFRGASFYVAELPGGRRATKIPLHRTPSLDFMAILSGRVALLLEDRELVLRQGDTLVQGGNLHGWHNRWRDPCLLLFVVLSAPSGATVRSASRT